MGVIKNPIVKSVYVTAQDEAGFPIPPSGSFIITEGGDFIITEDGNRMITE